MPSKKSNVETYDVLVTRAFKQYWQKKHEARILSLDYFVAGLPPLEFFELQLNELKQILEKQYPVHEKGPADALLELILIGLTPYFEAFCKDLFAAIVNICPQLLQESSRFREYTLPLAEVLHLLKGSRHRIGSILSEHYDWGSAAP